MTQAVAGQAPEFIQALMDRALALFLDGKFESAEILLSTAPDDARVRPMVLHLRGLAAMHLGQKERAREFLQEAIGLNPTDSEAHANLGLLLLETHRYPQSAAAYAAALTLDPRNSTWHFGLAKALAASSLSDLAIDSYRDACARASDYVDAEIDLASLLGDGGENQEAIALLHHALARHPERADLHMALAFRFLATGNWPAGWKEYEWRWADPSLGEKPLPTDRPFWQGEDLTGKTILLQCEQGFGDALQFARYAPMVKARGARVVLRAPMRLLALLQSLAGVDQLIDADDAAPAFDVHAPLLSLPGIFGARPDAILTHGPYLAADPALVKTWKERLGAHAGLSIGLCWQGNPAHAMDRFRSLRLDLLRPLLNCPVARFISLQIGLGEDQLMDFKDRILEPRSAGDDDSFAETAAIVANLDFVIGVDSAVVHLAGALGKPAWILLAARTDWRWLRERNDTPWYPQAKLFRQETLGDWDEVVGRVRADLWTLATGAPPPAENARLARRRQKADPHLCDALFVEGMRHYRANDLVRSKKLFERMLALDPEHVNTLCNLGALEGSVGDHHRARRLLERAVSLAPELVPARLALADALLACGDTAEAIAHYRKAIDREPKSDAAHAAFAMALGSLGDHGGAIAHFEQAVKINRRQSPEFYEALGRTSLARGNLQGAEISFRHALALHPMLATAHCGLADVLLALGRHVDAAASFRRARDIDACSSAALQGLERLRVPVGKGGPIPMSDPTTLTD